MALALPESPSAASRAENTVLTLDGQIKKPPPNRSSIPAIGGLKALVHA
jgi:hypothetical protein